jgi:hypothetical protein
VFSYDGFLASVATKFPTVKTKDKISIEASSAGEAERLWVGDQRADTLS